MLDIEHIERTLLGATLLDAEAITESIAKLKPEDFSLDSHRRIFRAVILTMSDGSVDSNTLCITLRKRKELDSVGGIGYIMGLTEGIPRNFRVEGYARIIKDESRKRQAIAELSAGIEALKDGGEDTNVVLDRAGDRVKVIREDDDDCDMQRVGDYLSSQGSEEQALSSMATTDGLKLGWSKWDEVTGGLQRGELLIVAAMASMGKTAWACNSVYHTSVIGGKVTAFFPLEQKRGSAIRRMLGSAARIDYRSIRDGKLNQYDRNILMDYRSRLSAAPLYVDDTPGMTMTRIKAKCSRLKRMMLAAGHPTGLDFVLIDQLSHTEDSDVRQKGMAEEAVMGRQAHAAKKIAEELNVPVALLAQMTQEGAKRTDPKPRLTDIAGSGKIKNHADIVAFLHRPWMFDKTADEHAAQMIIAKNREGATKEIDCVYRGNIMRWEDCGEYTDKQTSMEDDYFIDPPSMYGQDRVNW